VLMLFRGDKEVKEYPILMSTDMVKAILEGRKTMTRRAIKPQPTYINDNHKWVWKEKGYFTNEDGNHQPYGEWVHCPYGQVGDRLWVRETWKPDHSFAAGVFLVLVSNGEKPLDGKQAILTKVANGNPQSICLDGLPELT